MGIFAIRSSPWWSAGLLTGAMISPTSGRVGRLFVSRYRWLAALVHENAAGQLLADDARLGGARHVSLAHHVHVQWTAEGVLTSDRDVGAGQESQIAQIAQERRIAVRNADDRCRLTRRDVIQRGIDRTAQLA